MKTLYLLFILSCVAVGNAYGQTFDYSVSGRVTDGETIYIVKSYGPLGFILYNSSNKDRGSVYRYRDGTPVDDVEQLDGGTKIVTDSVLRVALRALTKDEQKNLGETGEEITVTFLVDYEGRVQELSFVLKARPKLLQLPPSFFARLEAAFKREVKFEVYGDAKKLAFSISQVYLTFPKYWELKEPKEPSNIKNKE